MRAKKLSLSVEALDAALQIVSCACASADKAEEKVRMKLGYLTLVFSRSVYDEIEGFLEDFVSQQKAGV
jgi:hypothetical protein